MGLKMMVIAYLILAHSLMAQDIEGYVFDAGTREPIAGASVYFDGSSMGVITNPDGRFRLRTPVKILAKLIVSHLGYITKTIDNPFRKGSHQIGLKEEIQQIPEVIVSADPFTRKQKLRVFRKEFLGDTRAAGHCSIRNEDSIELFFNSYDNTLSAYSKNALLIENKYLGYLIKFDLEEFKIHFKEKSLDRIGNISYTLFSGFTQFTDIANYDDKIIKRRDEAYLGSSMHFMRTCRNNNWEKENFTLKQDLRAVTPDQLFENISITDGGDFKTIKFLNKNFVIYHRKRSYYRSTVQLTSDTATFSIDKYGNYTPYKYLVFGGYMAGLRIGDMLPVDFKL
jgi:hypothetical protein